MRRRSASALALAPLIDAQRWQLAAPLRDAPRSSAPLRGAPRSAKSDVTRKGGLQGLTIWGTSRLPGSPTRLPGSSKWNTFAKPCRTSVHYTGGSKNPFSPPDSDGEGGFEGAYDSLAEQEAAQDACGYSGAHSV